MSFPETHSTPFGKVLRGPAGDVAIFVLATAGTWFAQQLDRPITAVLVYLTGVILIGARSGLRNGVLAAVAASAVFNFLLSEPVFRFGVTSADEVVPLIAFNLSAIVTGALAGRLRDSARIAHSAEARNAFLLNLSDRLQQAIRVADVAEIARRSLPIQGVTDLEIYLSREGALLKPEDDGRAVDALEALSPKENEEARRCSFRVHELIGAQGELGVAKFLFRDRSIDERELPDLQAVSNLLALAIDRCILLEKLSESRAAQRSEELKNAILSSVSHDLRTPLTAIEAAVTSLQSFDSSLSAEQKAQMLSTVGEQCRKLNRYTANLLDMGRIQAGISPSLFEEVDVVETLGVVLGNIRHGFPELSIEKELKINSATVRANAAMLEQAIFNVIENAAIHGDSVEPLEVCLYASDGNCVLEITDHGPGIARSDQPHVFKRFYRSDQPTNRRGNGLGLYITKGFIEAFGGKVVVVSPILDNRGTTIIIRLPLATGAGA